MSAFENSWYIATALTMTVLAVGLGISVEVASRRPVCFLSL
jgi:hypothetical protein